MLKTKQVGAFTVSEMGTLQMCNFRVNQRRIAPQIEQQRENEGLAEWLNEWAFISAVTSPFITQEAYAEMDMLTARQIAEAAEELNAALTEIQAQDGPQSKKKPQTTT